MSNVEKKTNSKNTKGVLKQYWKIIRHRPQILSSQINQTKLYGCHIQEGLLWRERKTT